MSLSLNQIVCGDAFEVLKGFPSESIDLVITSPPYNLTKEYEEKLSEQKYSEFISNVLNELYRVLKIDGRICWNVPNQIRLNRDGKLWSPLIKTANIMESKNLKFFDIIIWNQCYSDSATAWGSWKSPSAPFIRHQCESILVFYKIRWKKRGDKTDLTPIDFMKLTKSELWDISPETNRIHPAPFPEEIPLRCIKLFSFLEDIILDPFVGSGTTCFMARKLCRNYIGIDLNPAYVEMARKRIAQIPERIDNMLTNIGEA